MRTWLKTTETLEKPRICGFNAPAGLQNKAASLAKFIDQCRDADEAKQGENDALCPRRHSSHHIGSDPIKKISATRAR